MDQESTSLQASKAWEKFTRSLSKKSFYTKRYYEGDMKRFLVASHVGSPDELLLMERAVLQERITNYVLARQDKEGIRGQSITKELSSLKKFFIHNDRMDINWKIIKENIADPVKAVRLLMCSSGMRLGAIPELKVRHLQKVKVYPLYAILVYENTKEQYTTYCSPECRTAIDNYLDYRMRAGETIRPDSPVIREQFDGADKFKVEHPQSLGRETVSSLIKIVAYKAGLRTKSANRFERKETMLNHGLRKFFFRACAKAKIDPVIREFLMGHKIGDIKTGVTKLMMTYDATEDNDVLQAYSQVVPYATINEENRLKVKVSELQYEAEQKEKEMTRRIEEAVERKVQEIMARVDVSRLKVP
jgi:integrase